MNCIFALAKAASCFFQSSKRRFFIGNLVTALLSYSATIAISGVVSGVVSGNGGLRRPQRLLQHDFLDTLCNDSSHFSRHRLACLNLFPDRLEALKAILILKFSDETTT